MERPTDEQLAEIRERCDKATKGPWFPSLLTDGYIAQGSEFNVVASVLEYNEDGSVHATLGNENYENNREFIAHAREDVPMLLAEIEHLKWDLSHEYYEGFKHGHSEAEGGEGTKEIDAYRDALKYIIDLEYGKARVFYDEDLGMWYDRDSSLYLTYDDICERAMEAINE
ncbi:hypothetical protein M3626_20785 [Psychrobacillus sp. MER TA 17]|nr:hypothetical protein [Psychrobacillus sp. MER TA 17]